MNTLHCKYIKFIDKSHNLGKKALKEAIKITLCSLYFKPDHGTVLIPYIVSKIKVLLPT